MKLKGCVSLLNILQGYSIIHTYGDEQVHQNANACEQGGGGGLCQCKRSHITGWGGVM